MFLKRNDHVKGYDFRYKLTAHVNYSYCKQFAIYLVIFRIQQYYVCF